MPAIPTLELHEVDPAELKVADQVRGDATPDDALVESVRRNGVLQPPIVSRNDDGDLVIVMGHRRVGAAIMAGLGSITVVERPQTSGEVERIEDQIVENERRKGLTARELAQGYQQLELFGRTPADIAAALAERPERIRAGLRITKSKTVTELVETEPSIDLEQAAMIADFDENPKLQRQLIETATTRPENFTRDLENLRTQREVDNRVAKLQAQLDEEGVILADKQNYEVGAWWSGKGVGAGTGRTLERLGLTVAEHAKCPGHAAVIHRAQSYYLHQDPSEWLMYVCTDWEANGHAGARAVTVEKSAEDLEREAEWERQRAARAEAQQLQEANTRARRTWIHGYLTTGRLRPIATHFDVMADATVMLIELESGFPLRVVRELLTGDPIASGDWYEHQDAVSKLARSGAIPSYRFALTSALAVFEDEPTSGEAVKYFEALESWGYVLTDSDRELIEVAKENALRAAGENLDTDGPEDESEDAA